MKLCPGDMVTTLPMSLTGPWMYSVDASHVGRPDVAFTPGSTALVISCHRHADDPWQSKPDTVVLVNPATLGLIRSDFVELVKATGNLTARTRGDDT